jgi:hypothetical protein
MVSLALAPIWKVTPVVAASEPEAASSSLEPPKEVFGDVVQLLAQRVVLGLHGGLVVGRRGAVGAFGGQVLHALQDVGDFAEGAFGGLHHRDAVLGVLLGHGHAAGLGIQTGGDLQAGGVVHGGVDAVAGAQAGHGGGQGLLAVGQGGLGGQCAALVFRLSMAKTPGGVVGPRRDALSFTRRPAAAGA